MKTHGSNWLVPVDYGFVLGLVFSLFERHTLPIAKCQDGPLGLSKYPLLVFFINRQIQTWRQRCISLWSESENGELSGMATSAAWIESEVENGRLKKHKW